MSNNLVINSLVMSKQTQSNLNRTPSVKSIRIQLVSETQSADHLFGDALHSLGFANGALAEPTKANGMKQPTVRLSKEASTKLNRRMNNLQLDETKVSFEGSDISRHTVAIESQRSLLDSQLEADLKYRLGIQDYYVGKAKLKLGFEFNAASTRQTRAREMVLRMKSFPVRLVRKLV